MMACIDDSGSDGQSKAFVLAGFVATPEQWMAMEIEWKQILAGPPRLDYFKSNEAEALKGQFDPKRWTVALRESRKTALAEVVARHVTERISVALSNESYRRFMGGIPAPRRTPELDNPYFVLFVSYILTVAARHSVMGPHEPCEYIFDDQGKVGRRALRWWGNLKASSGTASKTNFAPYLGNAPTFRSDKDFIPLQAGDLLAGELRRVMQSQALQIPARPCLTVMWERVSGIHHVIEEQLMSDVRAVLLKMADAIETANPGTLRHVIGGGARRTQAQAPKRSP